MQQKRGYADKAGHSFINCEAIQTKRGILHKLRGCAEKARHSFINCEAMQRKPFLHSLKFNEAMILFL